MRSTIRDDRADRRPRLAGWLLLTLLCGASARAAGPAPSLVGDIVGRYSSYESYSPTPNGSREKISRSFWTQDYRTGYTRLLGTRTQLFAELRYSQNSLVDGSQRTQLPSGIVRVSSARYGINALYRPRFRFDRVAAFTAEGDTGGTSFQDSRTRDSDLMLGGYYAPARLPRFEGQLSQQHHFANDRSPASTLTQRSLRATRDFGRLGMRAGYSDQNSHAGSNRITLARTWNGDASYNAFAGPGRNVAMSYGVLRSVRPGFFGDATLVTHSLTSSGGWRLSPKSALDGGGYYRYTTQRAAVLTTLRDFDAYAFHRYQFGPWLSTRAGGGYRTVRGVDATGDAPYIAGTLSADGRPRKGVQLRGSASHSTNWWPEHGSFSSDGVSAGTTLDVSRTFSTYLDGSIGSNSGLSTTGARYSSIFNAGVRLQPLRNLQANLSGSVQETSTRLLAAESRARSLSANVLWQPSRSLVFNLLQSVAGTLPHDFPRQTTTSATGDWRFGRNFSLGGNYSNSRNPSGLTGQPERQSETYGFRMHGRLSRRLEVVVNLQQSNLGRPTQNRSFDTSATYRFGS